MLKRVFDRFLSDPWYLCSAFILCLLVNFITTRKQSLGQGNVFTGVCLSTGGVPLGLGGVPLGPGGVHTPHGHTHLWTHTPPWTHTLFPPPWTPPTVNSGRYASHWNAFLWCDETTTIWVLTHWWTRVKLFKPWKPLVLCPQQLCSIFKPRQFWSK